MFFLIIWPLIAFWQSKAEWFHNFGRIDITSLVWSTVKEAQSGSLLYQAF
jgi:hypothetical protein